MSSTRKSRRIEGNTGDTYHGDIINSAVGGRGNYNYFYNNRTRSGIDILFERIAQDALHNSGERFDPPKCHPNTRKAILKLIMKWVKYRGPSSPDFMWVYGPAGSGKSAIAQSIAELCHELGLLIGTFFFSRSVAGRNNDTRLVATIAYQIALLFPKARPLIEKAVEHDPALFSRDLEAQLQALVIKPLSTLTFQTWPRPNLIIIDGLDECQDDKAQTTIIHMFTRLVTVHKLPFILLFASRTEHHIREAFNDRNSRTNLYGIALDNTHWRADDDIRRFLVDRFKSIRHTHHMKSYIPKNWPSSGTMDKLVKKSSGQFIYASTVVKYVRAHGYRPTDRLDTIMGLQQVESGTPFAKLDDLYRHILSTVKDYDLVSRILGLLLDTSYYDELLDHDESDLYQLQFIEKFFSLSEGSALIALSNLHAILTYPEPNSYRYPREITISHASFGDFLFDHSRSGKYSLDPGRVHADLAICSFNHLKNSESADPGGLARYYSASLLVKNLSRACLTPELLKSFRFFDLRAWIAVMQECSRDERYIMRSCLPRYFTWLSNQNDPMLQKIFMRDIKIFTQCLLSDIQEHQYSKMLIWCSLAFNKSSLDESAELFEGKGAQTTGSHFFGSVPAHYINYLDLLGSIFFNKDRVGSYVMSPSTHVRVLVLGLEPLSKSKLHVIARDNRTRSLSTAPPLAPLSNDLFQCVSSLLSRVRGGDWDRMERRNDHQPWQLRREELKSTLSKYLKRCQDDPSFSVSRRS